MEDLHPAQRSRGRLPHSQIRLVHPPDRPSQTSAHQGAYSDLLSRLRVVEDAPEVAVPRRARRFPAHDSHRAVAHPLGRHRITVGGRLEAGVTTSLRGAAGSRATTTLTTSRSHPPTAVTPTRCGENVVATRRTNMLIFQNSDIPSVEVRLAQES